MTRDTAITIAGYASIALAVVVLIVVFAVRACTRSKCIFAGMPYLRSCLELLRRLVAKGDVSGLPLAERAINEYLDATPAPARKSRLRLIQQDVLIQRDAVVGDQRSFAEAVNVYIEQKLTAQGLGNTPG
ncbi:hypothetical protein AAFG13_04280 [Bradyrhizobium sp. B124]|uniref:hypothetical protein n=1 Tax=Bradyrhizobium sp. B124 TaxID=3140245 RepID=UPI003183329E